MAFEDGFTINSAAKGGNGTGTIRAAVGTGITRSFDLEPLGFEKSEIIKKTGAGTLNTLGATTTHHYDLLANWGNPS